MEQAWKLEIDKCATGIVVFVDRIKPGLYSGVDQIGCESKIPHMHDKVDGIYLPVQCKFADFSNLYNFASDV